MSNKRRRNEVEPEFNANEFLDLLDEYPFIYRSLQAIQWMKSHPFQVQTGQSLSYYHREAFNYFTTVLNRFFSGCNFTYVPEQQTITDENIELMILTPVNETDFDFHFCLFNTYIAKMMKHEFYTKGVYWKNVLCCGDCNYIHFWIKLTTKDDGYDEYEYYHTTLNR